MYRGRHQLGQEVALGCLCVDGSGTPAAPTAAPTMKVVDSTGATVISRQIPVCDRYRQTGLFQDNLFLDNRFSAGLYVASYSWVISATTYGEADTFEVVAGGDDDGAVIASCFYSRPHADFLVQQCDSGRLIFGRNPRVT